MSSRMRVLSSKNARLQERRGQHAVAGSNKRLAPSVDRRCTWRVLHGVCAGNAANRVDTVHLQAAFICKRRASARRDSMAGGREMVRPGSTDSGQVIRFSAAVLVHGKLGCPLSDMVAGWPMAEEDAVGRKFRADGWGLSDIGRMDEGAIGLSGGWPESRLSVGHHGAVSADDIRGRMAGGRLSIVHHAVEALGDIFGQTIWRDNQAFFAVGHRLRATLLDG
jgi:hypothetical protein